MKLKVLKNALAAAAFAAALTGGVLCAENGVVAEEKVVTYGLYTTQGLATAKSGKLFTQVGVSDAVILTADGKGDAGGNLLLALALILLLDQLIVEIDDRGNQIDP